MKHIPVLVEEVIDNLKLKNGGVYLDGTVGFAGHAMAMADKLDCSLQIIGIDRDATTVQEAKKFAQGYPCIDISHGSYADGPALLVKQGKDGFDGILLDLGASSEQFDNPQRGFSFKEDGPLDMRFDVSRGSTAADIVNTYQQHDLVRILKEYGEERYAKRIAERIVQQRPTERFSRTSQLRELVEAAIPRRHWPKTIHPATKTFQALRIEVNEELEGLKRALPQLAQLLKPNGRLLVISFHSLEDRIVKQFFRDAAKDCVCPKDFPVCRCDKKPLLKIVTKKPVIPSKIEIKKNVRSRSAKLRVAERVMYVPFNSSSRP